MKRFIVFFTLCVFVTAGVSADFFWGVSGKAVFTPIAFSDGDSSVSSATYNSEPLPRVGFRFNASPEGGILGVISEFYWDGYEVAAEGNVKAWVQPFPFIKLTIGKFNEDDFRGSIGNSELTSWLLPNGGKSEENIFSRFQANPGAHISVTPVPGLFIEAALGSNAGEERANRNLIGNDALDVYKAIQAGIGYKIPNIGFVRAQFIGNSRDQLRYNENRVLVGKRLAEGLTKGRDADVIEAAFRFDMIEDLAVDLGAKIPLSFTTDTRSEIYPALYPDPPYESIEKQETTVQFPYIIGLGAAYNRDALSFLFRLDFSIGGKAIRKNLDTITYGMTLGGWLITEYKIAGVFGLGLDLGMEYHAADTVESFLQGKHNIAGSDYFDFGVGPWGKMNLAGGSLKAGVMIMLPGNERYLYDPGKAQNYNFTKIFTGEPVVSIPIVLAYEF